jgi:hypothetical protein
MPDWLPTAYQPGIEVTSWLGTPTDGVAPVDPMPISIRRVSAVTGQLATLGQVMSSGTRATYQLRPPRRRWKAKPCRRFNDSERSGAQPVKPSSLFT